MDLVEPFTLTASFADSNRELQRSPLGRDASAASSNEGMSAVVHPAGSDTVVRRRRSRPVLAAAHVQLRGSSSQPRADAAAQRPPEMRAAGTSTCWWSRRPR